MTIRDLKRSLEQADCAIINDKGFNDDGPAYAYGILSAAVNQYIRANTPKASRHQLTFAATLPTGLPVIAQVDEWSDAGQVCAVFVGDHDIADDLTDDAKIELDGQFQQALFEERVEAAEYRRDTTEEA